MANKTFLEAIAPGGEYQRVTRKNKRRFNVVLKVTTPINGPHDGEGQEKALRMKLEQVLQESKNIDTSFGVLPWKEEKALPTIFNPAGAYKLTYKQLIHYLRAPMQGYGLKTIATGVNYKWRINATFNDSQPLLFAEKWGRLRDRNET